MALGLETITAAKVRRIKTQNFEYTVKLGSYSEGAAGVNIESPEGVKQWIPNGSVQSISDN
jgi:hypothetical protein